MMSEPADIILIGHGTGDALQLTVQAQRVLQYYGFAHAIGVPRRLAVALGSNGIELDHLDERMLTAADPTDSLLAAAHAILRQTEVERPVLVLMPGNPLFLNSLSRYLVAEGGTRDLRVQRLAGVSQLDVIINELGLDVAARGLQVFDAAQLAMGPTGPNPRIPTVLFRLDDTTEATDTAHTMGLMSLRASLLASYPHDHPVTLFQIEPTGDGTSFATVPLADLAEISVHLHAGSSLYIGPIR